MMVSAMTLEAVAVPDELQAALLERIDAGDIANEGAAIDLNALGAPAHVTVHAENSDAAPSAAGADGQTQRNGRR